MNCNQVEELLLDYLEKELDGDSAEGVEEHLRTCDGCRTYWNDLKITLNALSIAGSAQSPGTVATAPGSSAVGSSTMSRLPAYHERLGDFLIIEELGRGGMGVVYEAVQESLGRKVALKVMTGGHTPDASVITRFTREARMVGKLEHANIVPVYAVGEVNGVHFYAMKLIDGDPLSRVCFEIHRDPDDRTPQHYRTISSWCVEAAEALHHAHTRGVIHRDVKPSNLLLDKGGKVWVSDFGLAKAEAQASITETGNILGTPRYMSPEQCTGNHEITALTDVYSLGATMYELASGVPIFEGDGRSIVTRLIAQARPRPIRSVDPRIPDDLAVIITKCIEPLPQDRYETAEALATDLRLFLSGEPIKGRGISMATRAWRVAERHPRTTVTLVTIAVAFLILTTLSRHVTEVTGRHGFWIGWSEPPSGIPTGPKRRDDTHENTEGTLRVPDNSTRNPPSTPPDLLIPDSSDRLPVVFDDQEDH